MSSNEEHQANALHPVSLSERIDVMDVLRGFALIGIILMNIEWFNRPITALGFFDPTLTGFDYASSWLVKVFVEGKFYKLFSLLFGMGFAVMLLKSREAKTPFNAIFSRRMLALMVIGLFHQFFIWGGDILHDYAFTGMLLLGWINLLKTERFQKFDNPHSFLKLGLGMMAIPFIVPLLIGMGFGLITDNADFKTSWEERQEVLTYTDIILEEQKSKLAEEKNSQLDKTNEVAEKGKIDDADEEIEANVDVDAMSREDRIIFLAEQKVKSKNERKSLNLEEIQAVTSAHYFDGVAYRLKEAGKMLLQMIPMGIFMLFPIFLLGFWLISSGVIRNPQKHMHIFKPMAWIGLSVGMLFTVAGMLIIQHPAIREVRLVFGVAMNILFLGQYIVAAGYFALIVIITQNDSWNRILSKLAPLGRMALTNYLTHSVVLSLIFYGYAGAMFGEISRAPQMLLAFVILFIQLLFSTWWLNHYRFGPLEWAWRCITYMKLQPMRLQGVQGVVQGVR